MGDEESEAVLAVLSSGWLAAGKETEAFEQEFAAYVGCRFAVFTNSCTSALKLAYHIALELGVDGISYPVNTFCATYAAAAELGLVIYPRSCQHIGVKESQCPECSSFANGVKKSSTTGQVTNGDFVRELALQNGKRANISAQLPKLNPGKDYQDRDSKNADQRVGTENGITQPIVGLEGTILDPKSVNTVKSKVKQYLVQTISNGQAQSILVPEGERIGYNSAENATSTMTIAKVNVHYGSCLDKTPCLIEDSAHRIEPNDPLVGKIRCYSFYATKNMTTGSGGMVVTNDKEIYERLRLYWRDGLTTTTLQRSGGAFDYDVKVMAGGYDGNDIAAAIGRTQLKKLPLFTARRNQIRDRYNRAFGTTWAGNHLWPYFVDSTEEVGPMINYLRSKGIGAGYHYPGTGWKGVSLPIYPDLGEDEQEYIIRNCLRYRSNA